MIELKKESERVLLVGVGLPGQDDVEDSLKELSELAATDRKSTRLNSSHSVRSRMPSSA